MCHLFTPIVYTIQNASLNLGIKQFQSHRSLYSTPFAKVTEENEKKYIYIPKYFQAFHVGSKPPLQPPLLKATLACNIVIDMRFTVMRTPRKQGEAT
jgi:hypothetical protein